MVTHDQNEALTLSRRVAVLNGGTIEQLGQPDELIRHPRTAFVARFVGERNLYEGQVESCEAEHCTIRTDIGRFKIGRTADGFQDLAPGCRLVYVIDVENVRSGALGENTVTGEVVSHSLRGSRRLVRVALPSGHLVSFETQASAPPELQSVVEVSWHMEDGYVLPASQQVGQGRIID
jgi:ABC-type Fe3+/spermidine/putrescine transport system ATPase subunit